jgi:hypothetical protein
MGRKGTAIRAALFGPCASARLVLLVVLGFAYRNGLLDVLERESELLGVELFRAPAELGGLSLRAQTQRRGLKTSLTCTADQQRVDVNTGLESLISVLKLVLYDVRLAGRPRD